MASAAVEPASSMKASASMEASSEAGLSAEGIALGLTAVIKATKGSGMDVRLEVRLNECMLRCCKAMLWRRKSMLRCGESAGTGISGNNAATVNFTCVAEVFMRTIGVVVPIYKRCAVGNICVVVVNDVAVMPVVAPVVPPPAEPAKEADSKA